MLNNGWNVKQMPALPVAQATTAAEVCDATGVEKRTGSPEHQTYKPQIRNFFRGFMVLTA